MEENKTGYPAAFVRILTKLLPILPALGILIALALSFGLIFDFDEIIGHFDFGSVKFYVLCAGIAAAAILSAVLGIASRHTFSLNAYPDSPLLSLCASYFTAIMALMTTFTSLYDLLVLHLRNAGESKIELVGLLLLPALSLSMILGAHAKTRSSIPRIVLALLAALSVNLNMFACYFDFTLPLNSPVRNVITIVQAGVLLLLLSETRLALSCQSRASAPFFIFTSAFAASAVLGISFGLCCYAFTSADAGSMGISIYRYAAYFGVGLLGLSRLLSLKTTAGPFVEPEPEKDKDKDKTKTDPEDLSSPIHPSENE
ncbi:MAG: hypothetical protein ACI4V1_07170 [Eubacteriales bacterium]